MERQCTPAEIAEKRRIALEIQQQKKAARTVQDNPGKSGLTAEQKNLIEQNKLRAIELRKAKAAAEKSRIEQNRLRALEILKTKPAGTPGKADSALKAANSNRQHPYLPTPKAAAAVEPPKPTKPIIPVICHFEIVSELRFEARLEKYDETVINSFKKISSKDYCRPSTWSFSLSDYENLLAELSTIKDRVTPKPVPQFCLNFFREESPVPDQTCLQSIEPVLEESLKDFQREGVCFGISRGGRFLLADDPGLGKTRQALAVADYYRSDFPLLIVTQASVRDFWRDQIFELLPNLNMMEVATIDSNNKGIGHAKVVIASYNAITSNIEKLVQKRFGVVIFDESHRLKESTSKQTVNATILGKQAARVILISGTPALSRPRELFQQLAIIDSRLNNFRSFGERYCEGKFGKFGFEANGACNLKELKALLNKKFMIRRTKDDVFSELGAKERIIVELPKLKDKNSASQMHRFGEEFRVAHGKNQEREILIQWYTETARLKADLVCSYIEDFVKKSNEKFLIFGHHRTMLDAIQSCLFKLNVNFVRIGGETKAEDRDKFVQRFQLDCDTRCALLSLKACSVGLTLTAASTVIFAELHWTPSDIVQAEGRVHRIGQDRQVKCYFLLAPDTADQIMWKMLQKKQDNISKAGLFSNNEHFSSQIVRTTFEPGASTSTSTPNKSIRDYLVQRTPPRKSDEMDTSDSFLTCRTSCSEDEVVTEVEMADASSSKELELTSLEADFLEMPSYHTEFGENNNNEVLSQPGRSNEVAKKQSQNYFDDDDDAIFLEVIAKEEMKKRQVESAVDDFADLIFSDEEASRD